MLDMQYRTAESRRVVTSLPDGGPDSCCPDKWPTGIVVVDAPGDVVQAEGVMTGKEGTEPIQQLESADPDADLHRGDDLPSLFAAPGLLVVLPIDLSPRGVRRPRQRRATRLDGEGHTPSSARSAVRRSNIEAASRTASGLESLETAIAPASSAKSGATVFRASLRTETSGLLRSVNAEVLHSNRSAECRRKVLLASCGTPAGTTAALAPLLFSPAGYLLRAAAPTLASHSSQHSNLRARQ